MNTESSNGADEDFESDEEYTDTSMFNAEDIVKSMEEVAIGRKAKADAIDKSSLSRKQFEALQEEKRLREELKDLEDYEL